MSKNRLKKGFTIIELIVVIAILGVLVLLAAPKFLGYTTDAKVANVKNDIAAYENAIEKERIDDDKYIKNWEKVDVPTMESLKKSLFNKKGLINSKNEVSFGGEYYKIPEDSKLIKTSLKGDFYLGEGGEVYYYDEKLANKVNGKSEESSQPSEPAPPVKPEHPTDKDLGYSEADFTWVNYYSGYVGLNREIGYFKYTGTGRSTVEIPHVIQGVPVTSYYNMFKHSPAEVTKVISTNKNVTNMRSMFENSNSTFLDLSELDTSNVTNMSEMFAWSKATRTNLDLSNFDTSNVMDMSYMFVGSNAENITFGPNFKTSKVTDMYGMFSRSKSTSLDLSNFDTSNVTNMNGMFSYSKFTSLDLSSFNTSKVTNMSGMFKEVDLDVLDLSNFDTSNVTQMNNIYSTITNSGGSGNGDGLFQDAKIGTLKIDGKFNTSKVTSFSSMFYNATIGNIVGLENLDVSNANQFYDTFNRLRLGGIQDPKVDLSKWKFNFTKIVRSDNFIAMKNFHANMNKVTTDTQETKNKIIQLGK